MYDNCYVNIIYLDINIYIYHIYQSVYNFLNQLLYISIIFNFYRSPREDDREFIIGDRVLLKGNKKGLIHYIGPVHFKNTMMYGIELLNDFNNHDGKVDDTRYFQV